MVCRSDEFAGCGFLYALVFLRICWLGCFLLCCVDCLRCLVVCFDCLVVSGVDLDCVVWWDWLLSG